MEDFKIPEKWCVQTSEEHHEEIKKFFDEKHDAKHGCFNAYKNHYFHFPKCGNGGYWAIASVEKGYTEITFEQFEKHILNKEKVDKKIIGYNLVKKEYNSAACDIAGVTNLSSNSLERGGCSFLANTPCYERLKKAGVLDLWFEPAYEKESVKIFIGQKPIEVTISKCKIEADGDRFSISNIRRIYNMMSTDSATIAGDKKVYDVKINKTVKVGCTEFTLEDIKLLIFKYNELNIQD